MDLSASSVMELMAHLLVRPTVSILIRPLQDLPRKPQISPAQGGSRPARGTAQDKFMKKPINVLNDWGHKTINFVFYFGEVFEELPADCSVLVGGVVIQQSIIILAVFGYSHTFVLFFFFVLSCTINTFL